MIPPAPPRIKKYKTVTDSFAQEMDTIINNLLDEGWELYGKPRSFRSGDVSYRFVQTMVKYG